MDCSVSINNETAQLFSSVMNRDNDIWMDEASLEELDQMVSHHFDEIQSSNSYITVLNNCIDSWRDKPILQWNHIDVLRWIISHTYEKNCAFPYSHLENYSRVVDGTFLCNMSLNDFLVCDRMFGSILYEGVQNYWKNENIFKILPSYETFNQNESTSSIISNSNGRLLSNEQCKNSLLSPVSSIGSDGESNYLTCLDRPDTIRAFEDKISSPTMDQSSDEEDSLSENGSRIIPQSRGRGRPRGSKIKKERREGMGRLWEFIRSLLHNPTYCPSLIRWENHEEGIFRFVRTEKIAQLWGSRKSNEGMNYEKLSRALRYYYKTNVFQPVLGRRLVYKFGPSAHGWRTTNPNFEQKFN